MEYIFRIFFLIKIKNSRVWFFQSQKPTFLNQPEALVFVFINTYKIIRVYKCVSFLDTVKAKLMGITALVYITPFQKNTVYD